MRLWVICTVIVLAAIAGTSALLLSPVAAHGHYGWRYPLRLHSSALDGTDGQAKDTFPGAEVTVAIDVENLSRLAPRIWVAFSLSGSFGVRNDIETAQHCGILIERRMTCRASFYVPHDVKLGENYSILWSLHGNGSDQRYLAWDYRHRLRITIGAEACAPRFIRHIVHPRVLTSRVGDSLFAFNDLSALAMDSSGNVPLLDVWQLQSNPCDAATTVRVFSRLQPGLPSPSPLIPVVDVWQPVATKELVLDELSEAFTNAARYPDMHNFDWAECVMKAESSSWCRARASLNATDGIGGILGWGLTSGPYTLDVSILQEVELTSGEMVGYHVIGHYRLHLIKRPGAIEAVAGVLDAISSSIVSGLTSACEELGAQFTGSAVGSPIAPLGATAGGFLCNLVVTGSVQKAAEAGFIAGCAEAGSLLFEKAPEYIFPAANPTLLRRGGRAVAVPGAYLGAKTCALFLGYDEDTASEVATQEACEEVGGELGERFGPLWATAGAFGSGAACELIFWGD